MDLEFIDNSQNRSLVAWIVVIQAVGVSLGIFMRGDIKNWYNKLYHSPYTPPSWAAPIVWTILYTLIAIAGWRL